MLEILSYDVYGMERAMVASGLPMAVDSSTVKLSEKRMSVLGNAKHGSGHDCACKGIIVEARIKYPLYWTKQFQRYHFADIVSSQSTMHRVTKFNMGEQCNEWVDKEIINIVQGKVDMYNIMEKEKLDYLYIGEYCWVKELGEELHPDDFNKVYKKDLFMQIISSLPSGFEMEMEIVTNYLQLKTIYEQRKHHKLPDWQVFCEWIESLPKFKEFCLKEK